MDKPLMIAQPWPGEPDERPGVAGLLTCGHYGVTHGEASSQWDFPHEEQACPKGCGIVQFDLRLQVDLMAAYMGPLPT